MFFSNVDQKASFSVGKRFNDFLSSTECLILSFALISGEMTSGTDASIVWFVYTAYAFVGPLVNSISC